MQNLTRYTLPTAVLAGLVALTLSTHVFTSIDRLRVRLLQAPINAEAGAVRVTTTDPQVNALQPPFAVIARITTSSPETSSFAIIIDGAPVCKREVAGRSRRVDCAVTGQWNSTTAHQVMIEGPPRAWTLDYLELATHHGRTGSLHYVIVLPASSNHYVRPAFGWVFGTWALIAAALVFLPAAPPVSRRVQLLFRVVGYAIVLELGLSLCSEWISNYRIVISAGTFAGSMVALFAPRLWAAGLVIRRAGEAQREQRNVALAVAVALCLSSVATWMLLLRGQWQELQRDRHQIQIERDQISARQAQFNAQLEQFRIEQEQQVRIQQEQTRIQQEQIRGEREQLRSQQKQIKGGRERLQAEGQQTQATRARYNLFAELQPVKLANCQFERFGEANDGGYVLCANLLASVQSAYSYGISGYDQWGCDISRRLVVPVHEYDCFNLTRPLCSSGRPVFHEECIGGETATIEGRPFDTLENQFKRNGDSAKRLVVKMDVEGSEWDALLRTPDDVLARIDQLAIEMHGVSEAERLIRIVRKLKQFFYVANVHYNNYACRDGIAPFPSEVYEVLFVSNRLAVTGGAGPGGAPPGLTAPNNPAGRDCQSLPDSALLAPPIR